MANADVPLFLTANTVKGDKVINMAGEHLGKIEDLMIDLEYGRIVYAVLSFGGFLGIGNKLFAIPWEALSVRPHEHSFALNVSKEVLEKAQGFDKDKWPLTREELFGMYTYYGYQPYWQTGGLEHTGIPEETESERTARMERERLRQAGAPERRM
ncbi:MAG: PRC-barrel domain-containing protein [Methanosarcina sp.]